MFVFFCVNGHLFGPNCEFVNEPNLLEGSRLYAEYMPPHGKYAALELPQVDVLLCV